MARTKVQVAGGPGVKPRTVTIDTDATVGATVGSNLFLDGVVATPAALRTWLGVSTGSGTSAAGGRPLTVTSDTNITLTPGGAPGSALLSAASISAGWTGQLAAPRGGTGFGSYTAGDLLYANSTTSLAKLGVGSAGDILRVSGGAPAWQSASTLASDFVTTSTNQTSGLTGNKTWSGLHTFDGGIVSTIVGGGPSAGLRLVSAAPAMAYTETDQATDEKSWTNIANGKFWRIRTVDDANTANRDALAVQRGTGIAVAAQFYGNSTDNPPHTFFGGMIFASLSATAVSLGAADSGGTGFRVLRVPN